MKGNAKRVICLFLATIIVVTTVGYAPPSLALTTMSNSKMEEAEEIVAKVTTPSEAESTGDKATPSEAEKPGKKATPSEAVRKFIQVEPEEIPEYYSQVKKAGKRFWKFEDRNGMIQYRDYGYVDGEAEFPLWYEADLTGSVEDMSSSINLEEEYYNLAPYIFKSVVPDKQAWVDLSWRLFYNSFNIEEYVKENIVGFNNWDASSYDIWHLTGTEDNTGYHFYGIILNESKDVRKPNWFYADEVGNVVIHFLKPNFLAQTVGPNLIKYYYADKETYPDSYYNMSASYIDNISSLGDEDYYVFRTPTLSGHTFLGWSDLMCYNYGEYRLDIRMNPQNYDYDSHIQGGGFSSLILPGTKLKKKYLKNRNELTAVWIPNGYESLVLMRDYDFMDPNNVLHVDEFKNENWEKAIWSVAVIVRKPGVTYNLSRLPDKNKKWHSTKFHADLGDYITEDGERISDSYNFKNKKGITYAFAEWIPSKYSVTFKDYYGNVIGQVQTVDNGNSVIPPEAPERAGYRFIGWDKPYTNIQNDTVLTAQYEIISPRLTLYGNGGTLSDCSTVEMEVTVGESFDQILANGKDHASRKYYTFDGWYTEPSGGSKYPESGNLMPDTEVTAYAHWERSSSEVIFKDWDGMILENQEVAIGVDATPPQLPERQGYTFNGWDKSYSNIQDHSTITAQYTINGYELWR
ncbi:InlB B-repeat-containing protein [Lacrimispora defluvii]|uniref:InlB B-repeat-containing protein n=1 Tax=Lacrimispora defluvii TaxID=2719233 RepID=A0ABX1W0B2_9FIRM|nr:InlB B-repeat-containing protein [Lacrimispora defluvii]NNJ33110.1 InlB B-repeat-containing protein [Lacrimispora defluvii]